MVMRARPQWRWVPSLDGTEATGQKRWLWYLSCDLITCYVSLSSEGNSPIFSFHELNFGTPFIFDRILHGVGPLAHGSAPFVSRVGGNCDDLPFWSIVSMYSYYDYSD